MRKGKKSNMAKKKTVEKALNLDSILFNCRDYLRAARNSGSFFEKRDMMLTLVFLRFIGEKYEDGIERLKQTLIEQGLDPEDENIRAAFFDDATFADGTYNLPPEARWSTIINTPAPGLNVALDTALQRLEEEDSQLKGCFVKGTFIARNLAANDIKKIVDEVNKINHKAFGEEKDLIGRVYEYFLKEFAVNATKEEGEFYTPHDVVQLIATMIEPYDGTLYDPCCGSGGMFIQSAELVKSKQGNLNGINIYGQEKEPATYRLAKMNLALRGISHNLGDEADSSFTHDLHKGLYFNYIMANPPFNLKGWYNDNLKNDARWTDYVTPPESNANYAWILHMLSHLKKADGVAGFLLGKLIEQCDNRNTDEEYTADDVRGISTGKEFIETKANMDGVSLTSYKIVKENEFAYVADTSRRGDKIAVAFNRNEGNILISSIYTVFYVSNPELLLSDYLFMFFNRSEFDRYSRFNSWGSARETFSWEDMCDIEIDLPPLPIQQKYVDIYNAMLANQQSYERGLEDLKLVCDAYIENLGRKLPCEIIGAYIEEFNQKNGGGLTLDSVRGIATSKEFINTKANMDGVSLNNYKVVEPGMIAFISDTSRRADKMSLALNQSDENYLVSSISTVMQTDSAKLLPKYLFLFFCRAEFDRYARFHSWGSARETFSFEDMKDVSIPIPNLEIQKSIVEIHEAYITRKEINEKLKAQIKDICPILIKGSIEEARKTKEA